MSSFLDKLISDPSQVFGGKEFSSKDALGLVKEFLDPIVASASVLDEIYTDGLDSSQVWGQVKLVVDGVNDELLVEKIPSLKEKFGVNVVEGGSEQEESQTESEEQDGDNDSDELDKEISEDQEEEGEEEIEEEDDDEEIEEEEEPLGFSDEEEIDQEEESPKEEPKAKKDAFGLNDGFFDIDAFNKQVLAQEENLDNDASDDEDIDFFGDVESDDEAPYYEDFFKPEKKANKNKKQVKFSNLPKEDENSEDDQQGEEEYEDPIKSTMLDLFADDDEEEETNEDDNKNLSSFERRQLEIQKEIAKLEQEAVAEKKWALKGESKAKDRPSDALLDEELEFERTAKPVPVITKEVTESIEELIRRRIKDQQFDELERRLISDVAKLNKSRRYELSEQKSSKSLAKEYEDDYQGVTAPSKTSEELEKAHEEISQMFQSLNHKLNSLCSAHFVPKPAQKALDVKVDTATISMEDAQPLTFSNSSTLAPQELFNVKTGVSKSEVSLKSGMVISKDELSRDEKQRLRRLNKRKKSKEFKNQAPVKKSKKNEVIDTLSKAKNLTVINSKGEKRDVQGNLVKDKRAAGSSNLKL